MNIEIYSKTTCPACHLAKAFLQRHGMDYSEFVYDDECDRQALYDRLGLDGNQRTVPQILVKQTGLCERIGGYAELVNSDLVARLAVGDLDVEF
jgi:glutaredoxin 3